MKRTFLPCKTLYKNSGIFINKYTHIFLSLFGFRIITKMQKYENNAMYHKNHSEKHVRGLLFYSLPEEFHKYKQIPG
jgi:hypothetical protein